MSVPKTNTDLIKLLKIQDATQRMILNEISKIKKEGGSGETVLPDRDIIKMILDREQAMKRLIMVEQQLRNGVYHKSKLQKLWWFIKRKIRRLLKWKI